MYTKGLDVTLLAGRYFVDTAHSHLSHRSFVSVNGSYHPPFKFKVPWLFIVWLPAWPNKCSIKARVVVELFNEH